MNNEDFVPFELAVKLKKKGFNYPCIGHYFNNQLYIAHYQNAFHSDKNETFDAPSISQVLKWLIEEKKIYLEIVIVVDAEYMCDIYKINPRPIECLGSTEYFKTYEQAAIAGVNYCLDNLI